MTPPSPEQVCARLDGLRREGGRSSTDDTCVERMRVARDLDGRELWALRSACMVEAPTIEVAFACNHEGHPDWPPTQAFRSDASRGTGPDVHARDMVGLRFGATLLVLAAAIALAAWARRVGAVHPAPRFVRLLAYPFLGIAALDAVLAARSFSSAAPSGSDPMRVLASVAPSAAALACAAVVMVVVARRYRPGRGRTALEGPYR